MRGFHVFGNKVAARGLFRGAVVGELGIEVAEAFVMLGGHHHVLHAGRFGELGPRAGSMGLGVELLGQLLVLSNGNAFFFHGPLVASQLAVEAEVNEHAEAGCVPPLKAAVTIFDGGCCGAGVRGVRLLGLQCLWKSGRERARGLE